MRQAWDQRPASDDVEGFANGLPAGFDALIKLIKDLPPITPPAIDWKDAFKDVKPSFPPA